MVTLDLVAHRYVDPQVILQRRKKEKADSISRRRYSVRDALDAAA